MLIRYSALAAIIISSMVVLTGCGQRGAAYHSTGVTTRTVVSNARAQEIPYTPPTVTEETGKYVAFDAPGIAVGSSAPAISGSAWVTDDGQPVSLDGKVHLIDFWFSSCGSCIKGFPSLKQIAAKYADRGLVVVAPSLDEIEEVQAMKKSHALNFPLVAGAQGSANAYGCERFPTMFLVGRDGRVLWKGHAKDKNFFAAVESALATGVVSAK